MNKLNKFIKLDKNQLEKTEQCNVIYKISCLDCNSTYVGQTKRKLKIKIKEHKSNIKKILESMSIVSLH